MVGLDARPAWVPHELGIATPFPGVKTSGRARAGCASLCARAPESTSVPARPGLNGPRVRSRRAGVPRVGPSASFGPSHPLLLWGARFSLRWGFPGTPPFWSTTGLATRRGRPRRPEFDGGAVAHLVAAPGRMRAGRSCHVCVVWGVFFLVGPDSVAGCLGNARVHALVSSGELSAFKVVWELWG